MMFNWKSEVFQKSIPSCTAAPPESLTANTSQGPFARWTTFPTSYWPCYGPALTLPPAGEQLHVVSLSQGAPALEWTKIPLTYKYIHPFWLIWMELATSWYSIQIDLFPLHGVTDFWSKTQLQRWSASSFCSVRNWSLTGQYSQPLSAP